jgi:hypothetical protein
MSEPEKISQRDHWQAIAEQLGLSSEEESPGRTRDERAARAPAVPADSRVEHEPEEKPSPVQLPAHSSVPAAGEEHLPPEHASSQTESERPRRGRRRRGDKAPGSETEPFQAPDENSDRPPRRGRTRKAASVEGSIPAEEISTEAKAQTEDLDDDVDEIPRMSEWNVPSWNDLIASLYRPER